MRAVVFGAEKPVWISEKIPTPVESEALVRAISELARSALEATLSVRRIGLGIPGMVRRDGRLVFSPNLPQGEGINFKEVVEEALRIEVVVDNDANCAGYAELLEGAAKGFKEVVVITLGTGIGGGLITGGKLLKGAHNFGGEIGHVVVNPFGPMCPCGRRGCWERYASGAGLGRIARELAVAGRIRGIVSLAGGDPEAVRGEHVSIAARKGDPEALEVLEEFAWWVGLGLANLCAVTDPELIVLGGAVAVDAELWLEMVKASLLEHLEGSKVRRAPQLARAAFGELAGAIGAAMMARDGMGNAP